MPLPVVGELGDAGRLAHPVDPNHQQHAKLAVGRQHLCWLRWRDLVEAQHQLLLQQTVQVLRVAGVAQLNLVAQDLEQLIGGVHADVGLEEKLLELVPQLVVDGPWLLEDTGDAGKDAFAGFFDALTEDEPRKCETRPPRPC